MPARRTSIALLLLLFGLGLPPNAARASLDGAPDLPVRSSVSATNPRSENEDQDAGSGFYVAPALRPAWLRLIDLPELGAAYRDQAPRTGVRLLVGILPAAMGGHFRASDRTILVNAALLRDDERTIVPILAHELTHAIDLLRPPTAGGDCLELETRAFVQQARVWETLGGGSDSASARGQSLDALVRLYRAEGRAGIYRSVASTPGYRQQCATLNLAAR